MENSISRILIETTVRQTLKGIQADPERSIRNLIDMALQFSKGRFQSRFFETAHTWLKNQNSAYYGLVQDAVDHIETEHLVKLGMNIGYNSCTWGARRIRENEKRLGFNIPWTVLLQTGGQLCSCDLERYRRVIEEGETLGIYSWMLFPAGDPESLLPVTETYADSAFFLFCDSRDITPDFAEELCEVNNVMPVVCLDETVRDACSVLREAKLPYSVSCPYSQENIGAITDETLFHDTEQLHPLFTVLTPQADCRSDVQKKAYRTATEVRKRQQFQTIPWELYGDTQSLDAIISADACCALFDPQGNLHVPGRSRARSAAYGNLFENGLAEVFRRAYPKKVSVSR